jgi:molybdopterin-guanine dinucleotide biosynthesis protein A
MPFLSALLVAHLAGRAGEGDVVIPDTAGELQPLHAVYSKACLPAMERRLLAGRLKVVGFFDDVRVLRVPEDTVERFVDPAIAFMNLNTPEDLARARALWDRQPAGAARESSPPVPDGDGADG